MSGRVAEHDSLDGTVIGNRYEFILAEVITTDPITGNVETSWTLIDKPRVPLNVQSLPGASSPSAERTSD